MRRLSTLLLGAVMAVTPLTATAQAWGQYGGWGNDRYERGDWRFRNAYEQGFRDGRYDAINHRKAHKNSKHYRGQEKKAYREGYEDGYRRGDSGWWGNRDRDRDDRWGRDRDRDRDDRWERDRDGRWERDRDGRRDRDGWGNGRVGSHPAHQYGYHDGMIVGRRDRATGHSFRPSNDKAYRDADRGYNRSYGHKDDYKQAYRQAYIEGYQRGYGR